MKKTQTFEKLVLKLILKLQLLTATINSCL